MDEWGFDNLVAARYACPGCGERRADELVWADDADAVTCATCGCRYQPDTGEVPG